MLPRTAESQVAFFLQSKYLQTEHLELKFHTQLLLMYLDQWFSTGGDFASQRTFVNVNIFDYHDWGVLREPIT